MLRSVVLWIAIFLTSVLGAEVAAAATGERRSLEGGWFELPPYAHHDRDGMPTGFDIALLREVGRRAGISFSFRQIDWHRTQMLIRDGQLDFGLAAFRNPERETYA